jgi:Arc/MetJ family transcription regulator
MRMHREIDDELVARVDEVAGSRGRSTYVRNAIERALEDDRRWAALRSAAGSIAEDHEWDDDPAAWVRAQRRDDQRRVG